MRVRILTGVVVLMAVAAGCSSSSKHSSAPAAAGGVDVLGGAASPAGVVALGSAKQTVPADLAFVVVALGSDNPFGPDGSFSSSLSTSGQLGLAETPTPVEDASAAVPAHKKIRAAVAKLGIASGAVEFSAATDSSDPTDLGAVQVEVPVAKLPKIATAVVTAITRSGQPVSGSGLRFAVRDCVAAVTTARAKALTAARKRAEVLATTAGVTLGDLTSVTEEPAQSSPLSYLTGGDNPCGRGSVPDLSDIQSPIAALDAKPTVELNESIAATYALADSDGHTVAATGLGERSGPADSADIVIVPESSVVAPAGAAKKLDRAAVLRALAPLGITAKAVEVEIPNTLSPLSAIAESTYVQVHVSIAQLKASGAKIVDAVQKITDANGTDGTDGSGTTFSIGDGSGTVGVLFRAKNCDALVASARSAAFADAGKRLDKLAETAQVKLGAVVGVAEADTNTYFPEVDPCDPDLDSLPSLSLLTGGSGYPGLPVLAGLDATPRVTEQVTLSVSREMGS